MNETLRRCLKNIYWDMWEAGKVKEELKKQLGGLKHAEKFYLISRTEYVGLFSYVMTVMRHVGYALEQGLIPVVDMRGIKNPYVEEGLEQATNWWELYFEQPGRVELAEADKNPSLKIMSKEQNMSTIPHGGNAIYLKKSKWYWSTVYREFFKLNQTTKDYFEQEYHAIMGADGSNVLGVLVRGTDRVGAVGHSELPTLEELLTVVRKKMKHYDKIYLATEEYANVERFEKEFPGKILVNKRVYYDDLYVKGKNINEIRFKRANDQYLCGLEYLSSIMLLSKCGGIVGSNCSGTVAAVYMNDNQYRDIECLTHKKKNRV